MSIYKEPYYKHINTLQPLNQKIEELLMDIPDNDKIFILDKLLMKYRKRNSIRVNSFKYRKRIDERPDENKEV